MVERLFFNGVNTESAAVPIGGQYHLPVDILPHKAKSPLPLLKRAMPRAHIADNAIVISLSPILAYVES